MRANRDKCVGYFALLKVRGETTVNGRTVVPTPIPERTWDACHQGGMLAGMMRQTATVVVWNEPIERALTEYGKVSAKEVHLRVSSGIKISKLCLQCTFFVFRTATKNTSAAINVEYERKHFWKKGESNSFKATQMQKSHVYFSR